jgi:hypothetical protein
LYEAAYAMVAHVGSKKKTPTSNQFCCFMFVRVCVSVRRWKGGERVRVRGGRRPRVGVLSRREEEEHAHL